MGNKPSCLVQWAREPRQPDSRPEPWLCAGGGLQLSAVPKNEMPLWAWGQVVVYSSSMPQWQVFWAPFPGKRVGISGLYLLSDPLTDEGQVNTALDHILTESHERQ